MVKLQSLKDLFVDELKDLYSAEVQLVRLLPKLAGAANSLELRADLIDYAEQNAVQAERLKLICELLLCPVRGNTSLAMKGLVAECNESIEAKASNDVRDANVIRTTQCVCQYKVSTYGTAIAFSEALELSEVTRLLAESFNEEVGMDTKLAMHSEVALELAKAADLRRLCCS